MNPLRPVFLISGLLLPFLACQKPATAPAPKPMADPLVVEIRAEPGEATILLDGKAMGPTPQTLTVDGADGLVGLQATRGQEGLAEKRVRFLAQDKAEVIFRFGSDRSSLAKALGLSTILVFDYGGGYTFDVNKFDVKPDFIPLLDRQAQLLKKHFPDVDVFVCGHTDSTGNDESNLVLSLNRAKSVAETLAGKAVDKTHLKIQGLGSQYPLVDNASPEGRARNRRTEVILPQ